MSRFDTPGDPDRGRFSEAMARLYDQLPPTWRPLIAAVVAAVVALLGVVTGAVVTAPSAYAATAILADGRDVDVIVEDGKGRILPPQFDQQGHALMPRPVQDLKDRVTHNSVGVAPAMGWGLSYMQAVGSGQRGLRFCARELDPYPEIRDAAVRAIRDTYDAAFRVRPSEENCTTFDLQFGANPRADCGSDQAIGCAALHGSYVRVSTRPDMGTAAAYWIMVHEGKHGGDLGHTGQYGGEGRAHGHASDMGFYDTGGQHPVDNATGKPAIEDWQDGAGGYRWNLVPGTAIPTPTPTPTRTASPRPTPTPAQSRTITLHPLCFVRRGGQWVTVPPTPEGNCVVGAGEDAWLTLLVDGGEPYQVPGWSISKPGTSDRESVIGPRETATPPGGP